MSTIRKTARALVKAALPTCRCGKEPKTLLPHPCPYKQEISEDNSLCHCCAECQQECAWDI